MAFLEIARGVAAQTYQTIVVDTAPTGHTLRLLAMPALLHNWLGALDALLAKHRYMRQLFSGEASRDEIDSFLEGLAGSVKDMDALLRDSNAQPVCARDAGRGRWTPARFARSTSETTTPFEHGGFRTVAQIATRFRRTMQDEHPPAGSRARQNRESRHPLFDFSAASRVVKETTTLTFRPVHQQFRDLYGVGRRPWGGCRSRTRRPSHWEQRCLRGCGR